MAQVPPPKICESGCYSCRRKYGKEPDHWGYLPPFVPSRFANFLPISRMIGSLTGENLNRSSTKRYKHSRTFSGRWKTTKGQPEGGSKRFPGLPLVGQNRTIPSSEIFLSVMQRRRNLRATVLLTLPNSKVQSRTRYNLDSDFIGTVPWVPGGPATKQGAPIGNSRIYPQSMEGTRIVFRCDSGSRSDFANVHPCGSCIPDDTTIERRSSGEIVGRFSGNFCGTR
jgi:hypothetical protein